MEQVPIPLKKKFFFIVSFDEGDFPNGDFTMQVNDSQKIARTAIFSRPSPASTTAMLASLSWNAKNAVRDAIAPSRPLAVTRVSQGPAPVNKPSQKPTPKPKAPVVPAFVYDHTDPTLKLAMEASDKSRRDLTGAINSIKTTLPELKNFSTKGDFRSILKSKVDQPAYDNFIKIYEANNAALLALKQAKNQQLDLLVSKGDAKAIAFKSSRDSNTSSPGVSGTSTNLEKSAPKTPNKGAATPNSSRPSAKKNNGLDN